MTDRAFPTDDLGQLDAGALESEPKPCCRRINWFDPSTKARMVTWCTRDHGHDGGCIGKPPRVVELDDLGPASSKRRRF